MNNKMIVQKLKMMDKKLALKKTVEKDVIVNQKCCSQT